LKHRLGKKCGFEEFDNCVRGKVDGFCSTLNKKLKESNHLTRFFIEK
jgi:hypothetical protein